MRKMLLLARSNLRKAKGQTVAITVLILLASLMLNMWLMLSMDYKANFERYHEKLNAEHVTLVIDVEHDEIGGFLTQTLEDDPRTQEYCLDESMHMVCTFGYNGGEINSESVILAKQTALTRSVGKVEIVEEGDIESGIYMPMIYKSEEISIGNTVQLSIGSNKVGYTVCGFFNSIMLGSHNCSLCELILTEDKYAELKETGFAPDSTLVSVRISDRSDSQNYEATLKNTVSAAYPTARSSSNSYTTVAQSRYISQMICSGIMSAMAFFILLIALVVIASNIINYIQENMKNLGALKAVGYTSRQLVFSLLLQFLSVSLIAAIAGVVLSYALFPFVNAMMISQTGIPYTLRFLPLPFLITILLLGGTIAGVVWLSSRRVKKAEPIVALRQGVQTHNFKRNRIPLEKTKAPLNLALALKTTFSGFKQNITVGITMLVLSLIVTFSGLMTENVIMDMTPFLTLIVGETADSCINVQAEIEEEFLKKMNEDDRVEKIYLYNDVEVRHVGGVALLATICGDFSKINNPSAVYKGRYPKYDNELAIAAKYAKETSLKIGDEITLTAQGKEEKFLISGFTQITNNLGKDCLLTRAGYERFGLLQNMSYYLNLSDGTDIDEFNAHAEEFFGNEINVALNIMAMIEGTGSVYVSLMTLIVIAILVLSAIVIAFVLYLLIRTMLNGKKRDYGIEKALGFTTRQLILQTALSFMPAVVLSTVVGLAISAFVINPLTGLFLSGIGIVKCTFTIPFGFMMIAGIGLIVFTFAFACLLSLKIRKITPHKLLTNE